jgi:thioredoxin reductase (NADPH)
VSATKKEFAGTAEVAIVGAGPIGLEMAATLKRAGVDYLHFDSAQIGHTISWWPRNTHFFSTSERLAIAGIPIQTLGQGRLRGEDYLAYLRAVVEQLDLDVHTYERVVDLAVADDGFDLRTETLASSNRYHCTHLILATGDMARPNLLEIPGEDLPHVTHYFTDPHRYFRTKLTVVGGRNSAVEAALRCWRAGAEVAISYRRAQFSSRWVKPSILPDVMTQIRKGNICFYPETMPLEIQPDRIVLASTGAAQDLTTHATDFVLLCTGFVADLALFELAGVNLVGAERVPEYDPETMETNVPGLYVAGTAASGNRVRYALFIENSHQHVARIAAAITGTWPTQIGTIASRRYEVLLAQIEAN